MIRKAVIPAAGLGTRLFPATKTIPKAFFPIVGRDGIARPAILPIVEEALGAGIDEVIIVVQEGDLDAFHAFFNVQVPPNSFAKLPHPLQEYAHRILEIGRHVTCVVQPQPEGFGHAVHCAHEAVDDEPFLLMLGDHLYHSEGAKSCARQVLDVYRQHRISVVGLYPVPVSEISRRGIAAGAWIEPGRLLNVGEFAEKPLVEYARQNLRVPGLPEDEYLALFGQYAIEPRLFDCLAEHIANGVRKQGEFQLTSALERLRQERGCLGVMIDGWTCDVGTPEGYVDTVQAFSMRGS